MRHNCRGVLFHDRTILVCRTEYTRLDNAFSDRFATCQSSPHPAHDFHTYCGLGIEHSSSNLQRLTGSHRVSAVCLYVME